MRSTRKEGSKARPDFYELASPRGRMLRSMTLNDISFWGADAFIFVIFALFVVNHIDGGSASHVGISILIYYAVRALTSIPSGTSLTSTAAISTSCMGSPFRALPPAPHICFLARRPRCGTSSRR